MRFHDHAGYRHHGSRPFGRGCRPDGDWAGERKGGGRGFGGRGGFGRGGFRGEGGGRRRLFDGGELRLLLLKLIADEPRHGYDLIRAIEEASGNAYAPSPGVVYPTLTLLADMGQITEQEGSTARRVFEATAAGQAAVAASAAEIKVLFDRLADLREAAQRSNPGPVRRAMHNLGMALRDRIARGETDTATLNEIADLLDEVARRIERL